jgi:hypothetical protein
MANSRRLILSYVLFFGGSLFGVFVIGSAVWGDFEASMLGRPLGAEKSIPNLRCPVFVSTNEIGEAYVLLENDTDKATNRTIRTHLSNYYISMIDTVDTRVSLEKGEKTRISWPVDPDDALYGRFYIIRVYMFSSYKTASQEGSCGIMVVDLPFSGKQIITFSVLFCFLGMGLGFLLQVLEGNRGGVRRDRIFGFMIVLVAIGLIVSFLGWWLAGAIIILIFILLVGANLVRLNK